MATVPSNIRKRDSGSHDVPALKVLIVYENVEIGLQALQLYQRVGNRFGHQYYFQLNLWKFEALGVPSLGKQAANEATAADLVIVAINRNDKVPLELRVWMEKWIDQKIGQDSALVLLSKGIGGSTPILTYLRDIAKRGSMTFLADSIGATADHTKAFTPRTDEFQIPISRAARRTEEVANRVDAYAQWGMND